MIFRKRTKPVECGLDAYRRWLRAQRPDFLWFLRQPELVQEALASEGDDYILSCIGQGMDVVEDQAAQAESEADAAGRLAADAIARRLGTPRNGPQAAPAPLTMGGLGERRAAAEAARRKPVGKFLGKDPDPPNEETR